MSGAFVSGIVSVAAIGLAAVLFMVLQRRRGQALTRSFPLTVGAMMAAVILLTMFASDFSLSSSLALKTVLAAAFFAGAAFVAWFAFQTWRVEGWSQAARAYAFAAGGAAASGFAALFLL